MALKSFPLHRHYVEHFPGEEVIRSEMNLPPIILPYSSFIIPLEMWCPQYGVQGAYRSDKPPSAAHNLMKT
jgi:hypothetical protein